MRGESKARGANDRNPAWTVAQAEASFSQVIEQTRTGPQTITRSGRPTAVVVSVEEWTSRAGSLVDFLAAPPLRHSVVTISRGKDRPRDIDL